MIVIKTSLKTMPQNCGRCPYNTLAEFYMEHICNMTGSFVEDHMMADSVGVGKNCPLMSLPELDEEKPIIYDIMLKRHGVTSYFNIEGLPDGYAGTLHGRMLYIYKAEAIKTVTKDITEKQAAEICNGIITDETAAVIENIFLYYENLHVCCAHFVEAYFVGSKWEPVPEWIERQKNDAEFVEDPKTGTTFCVTNWTISDAITHGISVSDALKYKTPKYDDLLFLVAQNKPNGSFSKFCYAAHFRKERYPGSGSHCVHTVQELEKIV